MGGRGFWRLTLSGCCSGLNLRIMLRLRNFTAADYPAYADWFTDEVLNRELGPIDEEWRDYVLSDTTGRQLVLTRGEESIGSAGLQPPDGEHPAYVITDIAVRPDLRRTGVGRDILHLLYREFQLDPGQYWLCFINRENWSARKFFERQGWSFVRSEEADMLRYEYYPTGG